MNSYCKIKIICYTADGLMDLMHGGKRKGAGMKPKGAKPFDEIYPLRCYHADRADWQRKADAAGKPLADWAREALNAAK